MRDLTVPPCPEEMDYLLGWARELARTRSTGVHGWNPISYEAVLAWARLTNRWPLPHEVDALFAVDAAMRSPDEPKELR